MAVSGRYTRGGGTARSRRRPARLAWLCVAGLAAAPLLAGCRGMQVNGAAGPSGDGGPGPAATSVQSEGKDASPLDNPQGLKPGLAAISGKDDESKARALIGKVATKGRGPKTGYSRDQFGAAWIDTAPDDPLAHNGCDTRDDVLKRDGDDVAYRSGSKCVLESMTLHDPYTGKVIHWTKSKATTVQIDHVMPLSYDWQMGAAHWTKDKREDIANDPLNLLPVDGPTNERKEDSGPATWLPPNKAIRCAYVVRFAQVSIKYQLPVTSADKSMMLKECGG